MEETDIKDFKESDWSIVNAMKGIIWNLKSNNSDFGTGFHYRRDSGCVSVGLMDGCSKYGSVIKVVSVSSYKDDGPIFISEVVSRLEKEIYKLM